MPRTLIVIADADRGVNQKLEQELMREVRARSLQDQVECIACDRPGTAVAEIAGHLEQISGLVLISGGLFPRGEKGVMLIQQVRSRIRVLRQEPLPHLCLLYVRGHESSSEAEAAKIPIFLKPKESKKLIAQAADFLQQTAA